MSEERLLNGEARPLGAEDPSVYEALEKPFALAFYRTTPRYAYLLTGIASCVAHTLFVIGQGRNYEIDVLMGANVVGFA